MWRFQADNRHILGQFRAEVSHETAPLYFPLANEAGALSWTSPFLYGGLARSHHEYLTVPLSSQDLSQALPHRDFWIVLEGEEPWAASNLVDRFIPRHSVSPHSSIEAGPGWFSIHHRHPKHLLKVTITLWCPANQVDVMEYMLVTVENLGRRQVRFIPYAAIPLFCRSADNVRDHRHVTALLHRIHLLRNGVLVQPTMSFDERGHHINQTHYRVIGVGPQGAFPTDCWGLEEDFLGIGGSFAAPQAVWQRARAPHKAPDTLAGGEAIAGFRFALCRLAPHDTVSYAFSNQIASSPQQLRPLPTQRSRILASWSSTQIHWQQFAQRIRIESPDPSLNQWTAWVSLQPVFRRLYGNSYLPQFDYGRGGRGWRDLWQDCLAWLLTEPHRARPLLLHNIGGIRIDGSNATIIGRDGTFIADRNNIPRTWMDHGVWPLHTLWLYSHQTGDFDIFLEPREYFCDAQRFRCRRQDPTWTPAAGLELRTTAGRVFTGSVFQHLLIQHVTSFFHVGEHNLCRLEGADWNDGLDMAAERGESVAFSAFYAWNLRRLADVAQQLAVRGIRTIDVPEEFLPLLDRLPGQRKISYRSVAAKHHALEAYFQRVAGRISGRVRRVSLPALIQDLLSKSKDLTTRIRDEEWHTIGREGWFNGYYDNRGRKVEGRVRGRIRMTLTGQVFPVMTGIATEPQVDQIIRAVRRYLRSPEGGIRLNTNFGEIQPDLGRAFSFAYGHKENGAIFCHMVVMYAAALYLRRRSSEGRAVWHALYRMAMDPKAQMFPGLPEYFDTTGRGMYHYLTGSASWLMAVLVTLVYGVRGELGDLLLDPQLLPEDFNGHGITAIETTFAHRRLQIRYENPRRLAPKEYRIGHVMRNGQPLRMEQAGAGARIARSEIQRLSKTHITELRVRLVASKPITR